MQGSPPTCRLFQASFLAVIEATLDAPDAFVIHPDHDLTFFREVMKFRDAQIQHTIDDAFNASTTRLASTSQSLLQMRIISTSTRMQLAMGPFRLVNVEYLVTLSNWIQTGVSRSNCYRIRDGGFTVTFTAAQTLSIFATHGTTGQCSIHPAREVIEKYIHGTYEICILSLFPSILSVLSFVVAYCAFKIHRAERADPVEVSRAAHFERV